MRLKLRGLRTVHRDNKKKDGKGLFLIHQSVDQNIFENIANGAWDALKKLYGGDENLKKVKLQVLRKQYENTWMKEYESNT